jgi:hypothetical protein
LLILENSGRYWDTSIYQYLYQYCRYWKILQYCRYWKILENTGYTSIADIGRLGRIPVYQSFYVYIILKELNIIHTHKDTGKILVLPVLCTSIVVPVSRPAASYYPKFLPVRNISALYDLEHLCMRGALVLANSRDNVTIDNILSHPVGPIPVSMFHEDGTMRKTCKSDLVKQVENEVSPVLSLPDFDFLPYMTWNTFVWAVTLVRRSLSADLMEFVTSYRSNTSATVCAFAKHDVNCLQCNTSILPVSSSICNTGTDTGKY